MGRQDRVTPSKGKPCEQEVALSDLQQTNGSAKQKISTGLFVAPVPIRRSLHAHNATHGINTIVEETRSMYFNEYKLLYLVARQELMMGMFSPFKLHSIKE